MGNTSNFSMLTLQKIISEYYFNMSETDSDEDQYQREMLTFVLMGIGGLLVCCMGIIGNGMSLVVLWKKSMQTSTSTYSYLSALAVCDMCVLMFTMVLLWNDIEPPKQGVQKWPWVGGIYPYLFPFFHPAAITFQVISVWLTLGFTVDRYIMICHPFTAKQFCRPSRARIVIAGIFLAGVLFNIPKFFEYRTISVTLSQNITRIGYDLTPFGRSHLFRELYHSWFYIAFVCAVPFLCLAVLNAFLMYAVRKSMSKGRNMNVAEKRRNDTTIMLISIVVVFFVCQTPALVSRVIWAFQSNPDAFKNMTLYSLNEVGNFLIILNSAINFVPYYFFGKRFRSEFIKIFGCARSSKSSHIPLRWQLWSSLVVITLHRNLQVASWQFPLILVIWPWSREVKVKDKVTDTALDLIKSYLTIRKQYVVFDGCQSEHTEI